MKILFRCDEYPPATAGGIGSVTKIVSESLIKQGHEVFVVGTYSAAYKYPEFSIINGVNIYRIFHFTYLKFLPEFLVRYVEFVLRKFGLLSQIAEKNINEIEKLTNKIIKSKDIDVLELVDYVGLMRYLDKEIILKRYSIPTVMRVHGSLSFLSLHTNGLNQLFLRNDINNFNRVDIICSVSDFAKKYVDKYLNESRIKSEVVYNPIEKSFFYRDIIDIKSDYILFVGKIVETKGAYSLIKAFNKIALKYPSLRLVMLGGGDIDVGRELVDYNIKERVEFKGYVSRDEIKVYIDNSKFCVVPTYFETFGMVAIEVMARCKALIFTRTSTGKEIITHEKDGLLVDPRDILEIANSIELLLTKPDFCNRLANNGYTKVSSVFRDDVITNRMVKIYNNTIRNYEQ